MSNKVLVNIVNLFDKLLYIISDRRAILAVMTVVFVTFAPNLVGNEEAYADQWFEFLKAAGPIVTAIIGLLAVIKSWTEKEPTGLQGYVGARKPVVDLSKLPDDELIEAVIKKTSQQK